jgi:hypothetical protein
MLCILIDLVTFAECADFTDQEIPIVPKLPSAGVPPILRIF